MHFSKRCDWTGQFHLHSPPQRGSLLLAQVQKPRCPVVRSPSIHFSQKCLKCDLSLKDPNKLIPNGRNSVVTTGDSERDFGRGRQGGPGHWEVLAALTEGYLSFSKRIHGVTLGATIGCRHFPSDLPLLLKKMTTNSQATSPRLRWWHDGQELNHIFKATRV